MYMPLIDTYDLLNFSPHPYVFFSGDPDTDERHSMTFIGFNVAANGDIIESRTGQVLDQNVISPELQNALRQNRVPLNEDFDRLPRCVVFKVLVTVTHSILLLSITIFCCCF